MSYANKCLSEFIKDFKEKMIYKSYVEKVFLKKKIQCVEYII